MEGAMGSCGTRREGTRCGHIIPYLVAWCKLRHAANSHGPIVGKPPPNKGRG